MTKSAMSKRRKSYHDGECVMNFSHAGFVKELREAELAEFPDQHALESSLDEVLWLLWVIQEEFQHQAYLYSDEIAELAEIRGIALSPAQIELALERAAKRVLRKQYIFEFDDPPDDRIAYRISEKGILDLKQRYLAVGPRALLFDGTTPWADRHLALPEIAAQLSGRICIVDKFYGRASFGILNHFKHGSPLQFLTGMTNENRAAFERELRDFRREVGSVEVRLFSNHQQLHDRYVIADNALLIVGHGIKDMGNKESFLIMLNGEMAMDIRDSLRQQFDLRWATSASIT
jgi:hypothetical protein